MDLDPERLRLKRMEEAMEAERRSLQEDKRRLEQERAQMDGQRHAAAPQAPVAPPSQATWSPAAAEQPQSSGSKGGLFLGLAGGVLLVGVLLVAGKAWLQAKADENVGIEADASAAPGQAPPAVLAAVAPPEAAVDADAASADDAQTDTAATPELDAVAAAAAPTPEAVDAGASEADTTQADAVDADATGPGAATQLKAEGAAPDLKAEEAKPEAAKAIKKASRPVPTPVKPKPEPKPEPAKKAETGGLKIDQSALGEQMRKEAEKKKQLELMGKEFKKSQQK
jgi:hypothetical protein